MKTSFGRRGNDRHFVMVWDEVIGKRGMGGKEVDGIEDVMVL